MSLYNALFGMNMGTVITVSCILGKALDKEIPRFRDIYIKGEEDPIPEHLKDVDYDFIILCRMGGGNYECWEDWQEDCQCPYHKLCKIEEEPWYVGGFDDDNDDTYRLLLIKLNPEQKSLYDRFLAKDPEVKPIFQEKLNKLREAYNKEDKE